jgi:hypothetical protein
MVSLKSHKPHYTVCMGLERAVVLLARLVGVGHSCALNYPSGSRLDAVLKNNGVYRVSCARST